MHVDYFFPAEYEVARTEILMCSLELTAYKGTCWLSPAQDTGTEKAGVTLLLRIEPPFIESVQWSLLGSMT